MQMDEKKKRGSNYTAAEKEILLELIKKYQHILENKETNAQMITRKRETWDSVCRQYNAVAVSGTRTWQQLRHLYENLKQRSKKNIAKANRLQFYEMTKELKKKASDDKKEINRTGGGAYKSTLTGQDEQILAMAGCQIKPLSNPYDDAALYFGDTEYHETQYEVETSSEIIIVNTDNLDDQDTTMGNISIANNDTELCTAASNIAVDQPTILANINKKTCTVTSNKEVDQHTILANVNREKNNEKACTVTSNKKGKGKPKNESLKEEYFKAKLRNAKLENRYLINKNKMEINKYKIEMEILKLRLKKLKSSS